MKIEPRYKVEQIKTKNIHVYRVSGDDIKGELLFPGVTGILNIISKPALVPWATKEALKSAERALVGRLNGKESSKITLNKTWIEDVIKDAKKKPTEIKEDAADLGTQAHAVFDAIILHKPIPQVDDRLIQTIGKFQDWLKDTNIKFLIGDTSIASRAYGYGGALDAVGFIGDDAVLVDFKTSNGIYDTYALQVAAYVQSFFETYGIRCKRAVIVRFGKEKEKGVPIEFEAKWLENIDNSFDAFLNALKLSKRLKEKQFMVEN